MVDQNVSFHGNPYFVDVWTLHFLPDYNGFFFLLTKSIETSSSASQL